MLYNTLLFDLDDTLYESHNGLWDAIRDRMSLYMLDKLKIPANSIPELRKLYYETYGTTLRGLQIHYEVDASDYLAYVHDLPLSQYIQPDPNLRDLLTSLTQEKYIFTNADSAHANRVLNILGVRNCFNSIIDVTALNFNCKPEPEAYQKALTLAGVDYPGNCVYLDDSAINLAPARKMGIYTILVGSDQPHPSAHRSILNIKHLTSEFPDLWVEQSMMIGENLDPVE